MFLKTFMHIPWISLETFKKILEAYFKKIFLKICKHIFQFLKKTSIMFNVHGTRLVSLFN